VKGVEEKRGEKPKMWASKIGYKDKNWTKQDRTGQNRTESDRTGQNWTKPDRTGQNRTELDRTGQNRTELDRTGHGGIVQICKSAIWVQKSHKCLGVFPNQGRNAPGASSAQS
jgi:hypothetical protein